MKKLILLLSIVIFASINLSAKKTALVTITFNDTLKNSEISLDEITSQLKNEIMIEIHQIKRSEDVLLTRIYAVYPMSIEKGSCITLEKNKEHYILFKIYDPMTEELKYVCPIYIRSAKDGMDISGSFYEVRTHIELDFSRAYPTGWETLRVETKRLFDSLKYDSGFDYKTLEPLTEISWKSHDRLLMNFVETSSTLEKENSELFFIDKSSQMTYNVNLYYWLYYNDSIKDQGEKNIDISPFYSLNIIFVMTDKDYKEISSEKNPSFTKIVPVMIKK